MSRTVTVGIKNLKNKLSLFISQVRSGTLVFVTDRDEVVAEIRKPTHSRLSADAHPLISSWIEKGEWIPPKRGKAIYPASPIKLPEGTALRLLEKDRT